MKQNRNSGGNRRGGGGGQSNQPANNQQPAGASTRQMVSQLYEMLSLERPAGQELSFLGFMQELHKMFGSAQIRPLYTAIAQAWLDNGYQPANFEMVWTILYDKYRMISRIQAIGSTLPASTMEAEPAVPQFVSAPAPAPVAPMVETPEAVEPAPASQPASTPKEAQPKPAPAPAQPKEKERKPQPQTTKEKPAPAPKAEPVPADAPKANVPESKEAKADSPESVASPAPVEEAERQTPAPEPVEEPKDNGIPRAGIRFREWCYMGKSSRSEILMRTGLPIFSKGIGESYLALYQRVFGEVLPDNSNLDPVSPEDAQKYAARVGILVDYVQDLFASITKSEHPERYIIRSADGELLAFNSCLRGADGKEIFFVLSRNKFKASFPVAPWEVKEFASTASLLVEFTRRPAGVLDAIYSAEDLDKLTALVISNSAQPQPAPAGGEAPEEVAPASSESPEVAPSEPESPSAELQTAEPLPLVAPTALAEPAPVESEAPSAEAPVITASEEVPAPEAEALASAESPGETSEPEAKPKKSSSRSKSATASKAKATSAKKSASKSTTAKKSGSKSAKAEATPAEPATE